MPTTKTIDMFERYRLSKREADDIAALQHRGRDIMTGDFLISEYELYDLIEKYCAVRVTQEKIADGVIDPPASGEVKILTRKKELNAPAKGSMKGAYLMGEDGSQFPRRFTKMTYQDKELVDTLEPIVGTEERLFVREDIQQLKQLLDGIKKG